MTRQMLALALTLLLSGNCFGWDQPPKGPSLQEQARAIAANSAVEVRFTDGSHRRGWISEVSDAGFVLSNENNSRIEKSQVAFAEIKDVKQVASVKPSHTTRNILLGVGITIGSLMVLSGVLKARGCC
jgi:hypothetical protein